MNGQAGPPRTGYAGGGAVNPLLMSVSLDSRSKNPMHYAEDREPLATRPSGAPERPDEYGYQAGGEVLDDEDEDELLDTEDEDNEPDEAALTADADEADEAEPAEEPGDAEPDADADDAAPAAEQPAEGDAGGGAGGGGAQPTGYQQPTPDEGEAPAAPQDTGYNQQPAPEQNSLKAALDYTRKKLGVEAPAQPAEAPAEATPDQQLAAASTATAQAAAPTGQPAGVTSQEPDTEPPVSPPDQSPGPATEPAARVPSLPPTRAAPAQPSGTASGPGNPQAIRDYVAGKDAFTPEQMTELLDRTNQTNPDLGQNGAIHAAFKNLVDKNDMDGASKFLQALRPSYDKVRALMIAAASQGDFASAMQLAERMSNLIPNGQETQFSQGPDGNIIATIIPENNGPSTQHVLTPEQFARYANSPLSLFDHAAEQGIGTNLSMITGQPGQGGGAAAGPQYAQAAGATVSDAGRTIAPGVTISKEMPAGPGPKTIQMPPPGGGPAMGVAAPVTGYNAGRVPSPEEAQRLREQYGQRVREQESRRPQAPQQAPQQGRPQESEAMRKYRLDKKAYDAFPMSNQLREYGRYRQQLELQDLRERENERQRGVRQTPEQRMEQERFRQGEATRRTEMQTDARRFQSLITSDNAVLRAITGQMDHAQKSYAAELKQRQVAHELREKENPTGIDPKTKRPIAAPFPYTEQDRTFLKNLYDKAVNNKLLSPSEYVPGQGWGRPNTAPAPAAPAAAPAAAPTTAPNVDLKTYRGDTPPSPDGKQLPADSPVIWGRSKSTGEWSLRPNPNHQPKQ